MEPMSHHWNPFSEHPPRAQRQHAFSNISQPGPQEPDADGWYTYHNTHRLFGLTANQVDLVKQTAVPVASEPRRH